MSRWPYKLRPEEIAALDPRARKQANGWIMRCPAHDDSRASLSVTRLDNGWAFWKCFTGCPQENVARALEARGVRNEWDADRDFEPRTRKTKKVKRITHNLIRGWSGEPQADHVRFDYDDGSKDFETVAPDGSKLALKLADLLYGLNLVAEFPDRLVVICEGEKAADALLSIGATVVCGTMGASITPSGTLIERFRDREVVLWPDNDDGGRRQMDTWRKALDGVAQSIVLVEWKEAPPKGDAADWAPGKTLDDLTDLILASPKWESAPYPPDVTPIWKLEPARALLDRYASGNMAGILPSGLSTLDRAIMGGFEAGKVYLLGAPTGGGKTTIMQDFATRIAKSGPVLFVTPEMTVESMGVRAMVREAGVALDSAAWWQEMESRNAAVGELTKAYQRIVDSKLPIYLFDKPDVRMDEVEEVARKVRGLRAVVIDYAQLVADVSARTPRYLQVGEVATRSTVIAKTLGVPVLLASQVNVVTAEEGREKKKRRTYSFRETSMLEHKADLVVIFDRVTPYDPEAPQDEPDKIEAVLQCHKNRHGKMFAAIPVEWDRPLFRITETARKPAPAPATLGPAKEGEGASLVAVEADAEIGGGQGEIAMD